MATTSTDAALIAVVATTADRWLAADASASRQLEQPAQPRRRHLILPQRRVAFQLFLQSWKLLQSLASTAGADFDGLAAASMLQLTCQQRLPRQLQLDWIGTQAPTACEVGSSPIRVQTNFLLTVVFGFFVVKGELRRPMPSSLRASRTLMPCQMQPCVLRCSC